MKNDPERATAEAAVVRWLHRRVVEAARGDRLDRLETSPDSSFWLGRISPAESPVSADSSISRDERLNPCAFGIRVRPSGDLPYRFSVRFSCRAWFKVDGTWTKSAPVDCRIAISATSSATAQFGRAEIEAALANVGAAGLSAEIGVELRDDADGVPELSVLVVNSTPEQVAARIDDANLYECTLEVRDLRSESFLLESLPDSYRYDRRIPAYGINCGVRLEDSAFVTTDDVVVDRGRPSFWNAAAELPDFRFSRLANDPIPPLTELVEALRAWGRDAWGEATLAARASAEAWTPAMHDEARRDGADFANELARLERGLAALQSNPLLARAFRLMNAAMTTSSRKYDCWRPFQIGFLLANLTGLLEGHDDRRFADIVWFATGGGKTETYLGLVVTAAFLDRLRGKVAGITAWSRFPLRLLSLQQTQRFADALAAAELVRRAEAIPGDPFALGFFVGQAATPNRVPEEPDLTKGEPDPDDLEMPARYRVLLRCPFCRSTNLTMRFQKATWVLQHQCGAPGCPWPKAGLPFFVVDEEVYRFLPTVVVGTLDKAAVVSMQAAMRGFVGAPWGRCSTPGHGFVYAPRSRRPNGCLVPGCRGTRQPLGQDEALFPPSLRLQDELHLLRDSLGAIDAHYEALLDSLQVDLGGRLPKVLGSSATLAGYEKQVDVLYRRPARVFPAAGPRANHGFWSRETDALARRFVALAPRGNTIEFAVDRTLTELQRAIRELRSDPVRACAEAGVDPRWADDIMNLYGVDVAYGNTLRDIEAVTRSFETQVRVDGTVNSETMTGRTDFEQVRGTLQRLDTPEASFDDRIHLLAASSMMSHGVDIDRLNVLVMLGFPLTTAEFIQTSARVGRTYPGLVFVVPRMARERDAGIFRAFEHFVRQGDRLVEPIPITRRSRRVLERTLPGLIEARRQHVHEPASGKALTMIRDLMALARSGGFTRAQEEDAIRRMLSLDGPIDEPLTEYLNDWLDSYFARLANPAPDAKFPSDLLDGERPMISLRDVDEQVPVTSRDRSRQ